MGVADDAQAPVVAEPRVEQTLLRGVGVLIFVHQQMAVARPQLLGNYALPLDEAGSLAEQIVKVQYRLLTLALRVQPPGSRDDRGAHSGGVAGATSRFRFVALGVQPSRCRPRELGPEVPDLLLGRRGPQHASQRGPLLCTPLPVPQHREADARQPRASPELLQLTTGRCVVGPGVDLRHAERTQALLHLARGLTRVRHSKYVRRRRGAQVVLVGDAARQRPRLAGAGARQDPYWSYGCDDRLALLAVQRLQHR